MKALLLALAFLLASCESHRIEPFVAVSHGTAEGLGTGFNEYGDLTLDNVEHENLAISAGFRLVPIERMFSFDSTQFERLLARAIREERHYPAPLTPERFEDPAEEPVNAAGLLGWFSSMNWTWPAVGALAMILSALVVWKSGRLAKKED